MTDQEGIGWRLRDLRLSRDLTQKQVADEVGITPEYLGQIERGKVDIQSVSFESVWRAICAVTDETAERARLMRDAGGKHAEIFDQAYTAGAAAGELPSLLAHLEVAPELPFTMRANLRELVRGMLDNYERLAALATADDDPAVRKEAREFLVEKVGQEWVDEAIGPQASQDETG